MNLYRTALLLSALVACAQEPLDCEPGQIVDERGGEWVCVDVDTAVGTGLLMDAGTGTHSIATSGHCFWPDTGGIVCEGTGPEYIPLVIEIESTVRIEFGKHGEVTYSPAMPVDEATRIFWESAKKTWPEVCE
jgi:hypothetical protein